MSHQLCGAEFWNEIKCSENGKWEPTCLFCRLSCIMASVFAAAIARASEFCLFRRLKCFVCTGLPGRWKRGNEKPHVVSAVLELARVFCTAMECQNALIHFLVFRCTAFLSAVMMMMIMSLCAFFVIAIFVLSIQPNAVPCTACDKELTERRFH